MPLPSSAARSARALLDALAGLAAIGAAASANIFGKYLLVLPFIRG